MTTPRHAPARFVSPHRHRLRRWSPLAALALTAAVPLAAHADPGELTAVEINSIGNNFGYFEYLPTAYDESQDWPVLVFLSGIGENGDGVLPVGQDRCVSGPNYNGPVICRNLRHGPQSIIWDQIWDDGSEGVWNDVDRPFIVIAPQNPAPMFELQAYDADDLETFFAWIVDNYAVDTRRMYITGMSMGGYSTLLYLADYPDRFAAAAVMPGIPPGAGVDTCDLVGQNIWVFHGEDDGNPFSPTSMANFTREYRDCPAPRPEPRITIYEGAGHNVWTRTIDSVQGMDDPVLDTFPAQGEIVDLDPFDVDLYTWFLDHDRPDVYAGEDFAAEADAPIPVLATTVDEDPITYTWAQTAGDPQLVVSGATTDTVTIEDPIPGVYSFEVLAVDGDGQFDRDSVTVTITPAVGGDESGSTGGFVGGSSSGGFIGSGSGEADASGSGEADASGSGEADASGSGEADASGSTGGTAPDGSTGPGGGDDAPASDASSGGPSAGTDSTSGVAASSGGDDDGDASGTGSGSGTGDSGVAESAEGTTTTSAGTSTTGAISTTGTGTGAATSTGATTTMTGTGPDTTTFGESTDTDGDAGEVVDDGCNCSADRPSRDGALATMWGFALLLGLRRRRRC